MTLVKHTTITPQDATNAFTSSPECTLAHEIYSVVDDAEKAMNEQNDAEVESSAEKLDTLIKRTENIWIPIRNTPPKERSRAQKAFSGATHFFVTALTFRDQVAAAQGIAYAIIEIYYWGK